MKLYKILAFISFLCTCETWATMPKANAPASSTAHQNIELFGQSVPITTKQLTVKNFNYSINSEEMLKSINALEKLTHLEHLTFTESNINNIDVIINGIKNHNNIKVLNFSDNKINNLSFDNLIKFENLDQLILSKNNIQKLPVNFLKHAIDKGMSLICDNNPINIEEMDINPSDKYSSTLLNRKVSRTFQGVLNSPGGHLKVYLISLNAQSFQENNPSFKDNIKRLLYLKNIKINFINKEVTFFKHLNSHFYIDDMGKLITSQELTPELKKIIDVIQEINDIPHGNRTKNARSVAR